MSMTSFTIDKDLEFTSEYFNYTFTVDENMAPVFNFDRITKDTDVEISINSDNQVTVKRINDDGYCKRYTFKISASDLVDRKDGYLSMIDSMKSIIRDIKLNKIL